MKFNVVNNLNGKKLQLDGVEVVACIVECAVDSYGGGAIEHLESRVQKLTELVGVLLDYNPNTIEAILDKTYAYELESR